MIERLQSTFVLAVLLAVAWLTGESASAATVVAWRLNQDGRIALYTWERLPDEVIVYGRRTHLHDPCLGPGGGSL